MPRKLAPFAEPDSHRKGPGYLYGDEVRRELGRDLIERTDRKSTERETFVRLVVNNETGQMRMQVYVSDGKWGYRPVGRPVPLTLDKRAAAEVMVHDQDLLQEQRATEAVLTGFLHFVPGGATVDFSTQGNWKEAGISFAGDVAMILTAGGSKALVVTGTVVEGGVIVVRSVDTYKAYQNNDQVGMWGGVGEIGIRSVGTVIGLRNLSRMRQCDLPGDLVFKRSFLDIEDAAQVSKPKWRPLRLRLKPKKDTHVDDLAKKAKPFATAEEIPGLPGGVSNYGKSGQYLRTADIAPDDLPYPSAMRPPADDIKLPKTLDEIPEPNVTRETRVVFASDEHSGSAGVVRLAELDDGRPVAIKTYYPGKHPITGKERPIEEVNQFMLDEARSARLFSDLGIGPEFHGMYRDADGRWNVVMDVVPGDFIGTPVNKQTFADLEEMLNRLNGARLQRLGDFQVYRTPEGRLLAIDPGAAASNVGAAPRVPVNSAGGEFTYQRANLIREAPPDVAIDYLGKLQKDDPEAWAGLVQRLASGDNGPELSAYLSRAN
jgi:hypothetical protein